MNRLSTKFAIAGLAAALLVLAGCASSGGASKPQQTAATAPAPAVAAPAAKPAPAPKAAPAAASTATPVIKANGDAGTVVFFRESKFAGAAVSFKVREGDKELGKLSSGTYFVAKLPPGQHMFAVHSEAKDELNLEVEAGETYYVQGSISMGFMVGRPNLAPSSAAIFDGMKGKLKDSSAPKTAQN